MTLTEKLDALPPSTGVYLLKDAKHKVLYVGKAKSLRNRVRTYFTGRDDGRFFTRFITQHTSDLDWVVTQGEKEALILENNLIKQFKPRYNIVFRDDKTYVSIRLDLSEKWPRPQIVRQIKKDNALYFGPYASARAVRETLRFINRLFPIRKCRDSDFRTRRRPCVYHQMGQCMGPCSGKADETAYREMIDHVILILKGKDEELLEILRRKMQEASAEMKFERAAKLRDQIAAIEKTLERQQATTWTFVDRDIFGYYKEGDWMEIQAMFVRNGRLSDLAAYSLSAKHRTPEEVFGAFLNQFYSQTRFIPKEVIIPVETEDSAALTEWLSELKGQAVEIICPQKGDKVRLVEMARVNAGNAYRARHGGQEGQQRILAALQTSLGLRGLPKRIECFDISNIGGTLAVGSCVAFENGMPRKAGYRHYKIKTVEQADDFAMMREVLTRRFERGLKENDLPDLAVIDGGKGQLGVAEGVLKALDTCQVDVIGLAKGRREKEDDLTVREGD
ncbi:MAG: excinuclease ABC subunit UvrC, partial [Planctomycetes bacterium]|nr:excinuclease ABC subunit UvrC [Planctomycetota bacterium]